MADAFLLAITTAAFSAGVVEGNCVLSDFRRRSCSQPRNVDSGSTGNDEQHHRAKVTVRYQKALDHKAVRQPANDESDTAKNTISGNDIRNQPPFTQFAASNYNLAIPSILYSVAALPLSVVGGSPGPTIVSYLSSAKALHYFAVPVLFTSPFSSGQISAKASARNLGEDASVTVQSTDKKVYTKGDSTTNRNGAHSLSRLSPASARIPSLQERARVSSPSNSDQQADVDHSMTDGSRNVDSTTRMATSRQLREDNRRSILESKLKKEQRQQLEGQHSQRQHLRSEHKKDSDGYHLTGDNDGREYVSNQLDRQWNSLPYASAKSSMPPSNGDSHYPSSQVSSPSRSHALGSSSSSHRSGGGLYSNRSIGERISRYRFEESVMTRYIATLDGQPVSPPLGELMRRTRVALVGVGIISCVVSSLLLDAQGEHKKEQSHQSALFTSSKEEKGLDDYGRNIQRISRGRDADAVRSFVGESWSGENQASGKGERGGVVLRLVCKFDEMLRGSEGRKRYLTAATTQSNGGGDGNFRENGAATIPLRMLPILSVGSKDDRLVGISTPGQNEDCVPLEARQQNRSTHQNWDSLYWSLGATPKEWLQTPISKEWLFHSINSKPLSSEQRPCTPHDETESTKIHSNLEATNHSYLLCEAVVVPPFTSLLSQHSTKSLVRSSIHTASAQQKLPVQPSHNSYQIAVRDCHNESHLSLTDVDLSIKAIFLAAQQSGTIRNMTEGLAGRNRNRDDENVSKDERQEGVKIVRVIIGGPNQSDSQDEAIRNTNENRCFSVFGEVVNIDAVSLISRRVVDAIAQCFAYGESRSDDYRSLDSSDCCVPEKSESFIAASGGHNLRDNAGNAAVPHGVAEEKPNEETDVASAVEADFGFDRQRATAFSIGDTLAPIERIGQSIRVGSQAIVKNIRLYFKGHNDQHRHRRTIHLICDHKSIYYWMKYYVAEPRGWHIVCHWVDESASGGTRLHDLSGKQNVVHPSMGAITIVCCTRDEENCNLVADIATSRQSSRVRQRESDSTLPTPILVLMEQESSCSILNEMLHGLPISSNFRNSDTTDTNSDQESPLNAIRTICVSSLYEEMFATARQLLASGVSPSEVEASLHNNYKDLNCA